MDAQELLEYTDKLQKVQEELRAYSEIFKDLHDELVKESSKDCIHVCIQLLQIRCGLSSVMLGCSAAIMSLAIICTIKTLPIDLQENLLKEIQNKQPENDDNFNNLE